MCDLMRNFLRELQPSIESFDVHINRLEVSRAGTFDVQRRRSDGDGHSLADNISALDHLTQAATMQAAITQTHTAAAPERITRRLAPRSPPPRTRTRSWWALTATLMTSCAPSACQCLSSRA